MKKITEYGKLQREVRKQLKMSIRSLSEKAGVSHSYLSQVENGTRSAPSTEIIKKIANALNYDYFALMRAAGHMDANLTLGQMIKQRREKNKKTIEELADEVNFPLSKMKEVENGELIPSSQILKNISEVLDIDYAEMMKKAGFWDEDGNFIDPFNEIAKERKWSLTFEVPAMEILENEKFETTRAIPAEEAYSRFLEIENLLTMDHPIYFNGKKLSIHQRNQLLQIANIVFNPSQEEE